MPLYDSNLPKDSIFSGDTLPQEHIKNIEFHDGAFYPFLKLLIQESTKMDAKNIYYKGYGEQDPFFDQSGVPKAFCERYEFSSPALSGEMDADGNLTILSSVTYRVYFLNDIARSPILFEAAVKAYTDALININKALEQEYKNKVVSIPRVMSIGKQKHAEGLSLYPIIIYDVFMCGHITQNLKELENIPFDSISGGINLKQRSNR